MCWEMEVRANLGKGEASMAWEMSWERVLEVARERRRRGKGREDVIVGGWRGGLDELRFVGGEEEVVFGG